MILDLEPKFPLEFIVSGHPVSHQTARSDSKAAWKARVKAASLAVLDAGHWSTRNRIAVTLYYFPGSKMQGDIDNIVKLILDALSRHIYHDDSQVERVVVQKFEPDNIFPFALPGMILLEALNGIKPVTYIRISDRPFEDLR